ncbi:MAG TPA: hypothetical protein VH682_24595 [Gemmataceae bacterium]|jgi:hypothetical protein
MSDASTDTLVSWAGWIRRGKGRWRLFCRACTEQRVLDMLLQEVPAGVDKLVRQGNADPNLEGRRPR